MGRQGAWQHKLLDPPLLIQCECGHMINCLDILQCRWLVLHSRSPYNRAQTARLPLLQLSVPSAPSVHTLFPRSTCHTTTVTLQLQNNTAFIDYSSNINTGLCAKSGW